MSSTEHPIPPGFERHFRHGQETLGAKRDKSEKLIEFQALEAAMISIGIFEGARTRGRKPGAKES
jgi:hypothetical protein